MGRYGGEEFLVVLPNCDESGALAQAERLRNSISETPILTIAGEIPVTCSLGLSWTARAQHQDTKSLLRSADTALYAAKRTGRNRVETAQPSVQESVLVEAT
jgi:diguanylate cyclase (GGDEF)-like protein